MDYSEFLNFSFFSNTFEAYISALVAGLAVWFGLWAFRVLVIRQMRKFASRTKTDIDDLVVEILRSFNLPFYLLLAVGAGAQFILWPPLVSKFGSWIVIVVLVYAAIRALTRLVDYFFSRVAKKRLVEDADFDPSAVRLLSKATRFAVWAVALLLVVQNLGFDITALVAGLGIGGIAIAFALQNILSDIFSSFSLYFDKPFSTGDFIIVGNDMGTVKHIGIKSTRLQTLQGQELVIPNKDLTGSRVNNYRKLEKRRVVFSFGVMYETKAEKLRAIPAIVKEVVDGIDLAELDRAHFKEFGDFSLNYEVVYYANTTQYNQYMDMQQEINLQVKERLEKEGIEFAYPTQTVYVKN
ncbi:MAG: mechanosensitive ion channel family protein [bacterium]|nr:mechanosensitive ion channel family protein [bacterium]